MDEFSTYGDSVSAPAREMFAIVPHDTAPISPLPKAIRANSAGTVTLRAVDSAADVTLAVAVGEVISVRVNFVRTSTTASLHGLA